MTELEIRFTMDTEHGEINLDPATQARLEEMFQRCIVPELVKLERRLGATGRDGREACG